MNPIVQFTNVHVKRGKKTVLQDISLKIYPGEIVTIIGLNGAGKTTLLQSILGMHAPSSGSIHISSKKIGYVPQKLQFDKTIPLSVKEFLTIHSQENIENISTKLKEVEASSLLYKKMGQLSGGELQKVLICNALLQNPEILILDEATAGVDVVGEKKFYQRIDTIHKKYNPTIIMVSHDIHTVFANSQKVYCLNTHICCEGHPQDVSQNKEFQKLFGSHLAPYTHKHDHTHDHSH